MKTDYAPSDQQWAAISAPLSPAVVIAGAGSGKTTLMAARVVYLVRHRPGAPRRGARPDLHHQGRQRAAPPDPRRPAHRRRARGGRRDAGDGQSDVLEPTVATYNAYAAGLLTDHGLRIGHEPDTRVITDAARYQLGARAVDRFTGEVRHLTDHPATAIQNLLALDSAMSEHLVSPDDVRALDADARGPVRAGAGRGGGRQEPHDLPRARREGDLRDRPPRRAARPGRGLPPAQARPRADGLLRPDRARRPARRASSPTSARWSGRASRWCCSTSTRTPRSPRPRCCPGSSARATRSPRSATPTRRSTAGAARRSPTSSTSPTRSRPRPGRSRPTRSPSTGAPTRASSRSPTGWPRRSTTSTARSSRWSPSRRPRSARSRCGSSRPTPTSSTPWSRSVQAAHQPSPGPAIGVLTRDNAHAEDVFDALTGAGIPVEIVGLSGLLRLPEVAEIVATLHLLHDVTANASLLTLLTGPRWAIGPRDLRLLSRRRQRDRRPPGPRRRPGVDHRPPARDRRRHRPGRDPVPRRRARRPRARRPTPPRRWSASPCSPGELRMLRTTSGEPLLDIVRRIIDTSGIDVELASAVSPAAPRAATTSTCS